MMNLKILISLCLLKSAQTANTERRTFPSFPSVPSQSSKWWRGWPEVYGRNVTLFSDLKQGHMETQIGGREPMLVVNKGKEVEERN
jgi:hypothetical protein